MLPQLISLGPITLNTYTFLIGLAGLAALTWARWKGMSLSQTLSALLLIAIFALAFGRIGYVALNWDYFREHTSEILSLTGISEHAAIVGGLTMWAVSHRVWAKSRLTPRAPHFTFYVLLFTFIGIAASIGCIPNGCAYGREVFWQDGTNSLGWLLRVDWPDTYGINNPRWPTQAFMALWLAIILIVLLVLLTQGDKETGGQGERSLPPLLLVPLSFAIGDFLIQFLRADSAIMLGGLRVYQWFDLALVALAVAVLVIRARQ